MAFDGQAGLEMMRSESPDLVLMDKGDFIRWLGGNNSSQSDDQLVQFQLLL